MAYMRDTLVEKNTEAWIVRKFDQRAGRFPHLFFDVKEKIENLKQEEPLEALGLQYLYTCMPLSDVTGYSIEVFMDFVKNGVRLRMNQRRVAELPDDLYLPYVLFHRVNEEEIRPCRELFHEKIGNRADFLDEQKAVLEVNWWCAENGTYHSDDARTISARAFYDRGYGRCGEESTFLVNALRSVGIPARQVYVPRWAHCDDNHAWVEAWADGEWHFLGACEPEPVLDLGWFNRASSRAMLIHSRWFGDFEEFEKNCSGKSSADMGSYQKEEVIGREGIVSILNETKRYAETVCLRIRTVSEKGIFYPHKVVLLKVLNEGSFDTIAAVETDDAGSAEVAVGKGSLRIVCKGYPGSEVDIDTRGTSQVTLVCRETFTKFDHNGMFYAPKEKIQHMHQISLHEKEVNQSRQLLVQKILREKIQSYKNPSHTSAEKKLKAAGDGKEEILDGLWNLLGEKDKTDISEDVLLDAVAHASYDTGLDENTLLSYVVNPRVEYEILRPERAFLQERYAKKAAEWKKNPKKLWEELANLQYFSEEERTSVPESVRAAVEYGIGDIRTRKILFVKILRSVGIPARLHPVTGSPEYLSSGNGGANTEWLSVDGPKAIIRIKITEDRTAKHICRRDWCLSVWDKESEDFSPLGESEETDEKEQAVYRVSPGMVRLITLVRLPNGDCRYFEKTQMVKSNEDVTLDAVFPETSLEELFYRTNLPDFVLTREKEDGKRIQVSGKTLTQNKKQIFFWLHVSEEPTEHILNEIFDARTRFSQIKDCLHFVLHAEKDLENPLLQKVLHVLPGCDVLYDGGDSNVEKIGRSMYLDFTNFPIIVMTDGEQKGVFGMAGYNVGTAELLLRLLDRLPA